ncbi:hypothetical protein MWN34_08200 [Ancylobacter sp. 6x-1]|uniref:Uncharacterized protein n=1 Tax=Ancylobacter crimeensis TaxID=2579147 RepID=A0ABT0DAH9_9HYPH|nr:hypothetical protein [Ancylobacter crimeensis]MCK0196894.1 hypothetical protein [Ancylobacter crimeensis]
MASASDSFRHAVAEFEPRIADMVLMASIASTLIGDALEFADPVAPRGHGADHGGREIA